MSLDKKAILKEIEVLIRSIKVHYDNIENEHRIPTIELELITSKIRKLHEKSIIYNHIHYMEEEQLQSTKRLKLDHLIFKHAAEDHQMKDMHIEAKKNELFTTQVKFEEKVSALEKTKEVIEPIAEVIVKQEEIEVKIEEVVVSTEEFVSFIKQEEPSPSIEANSSFKKVQLGSKIGINDRFRFIKNLFAGNGVALEEAIKEIEQCNSAQTLTTCIEKLKSNNQWNEEDESVIDFMAMLK